MVSSFCELLSKDYGARLDERGCEYLSLAIAGTTQMRDLLDDLVEFGRLGLEAERVTPFASDAVLDQVLKTLGDPIRDSGAQITREPLPRIYGNPIRFHQLMQNLVGNALKYVAPGVEPRIHVSVKVDGDSWRFSVADKGIGIEARYFEQIFEPFKRLHSRNRYYGTGLGLAICRKIIEGFGGAISVSSTPGAGSTFSFTVIRRIEENADARPYG
jgi:light-regulated signal transduction histidine kinase (bacteriophytochrome)